MPWPHIDDYFFVGAGMDLSQTGELTNHAIDGWLSVFGTDKFYVHVPLYSYSLAGWIYIFGISTVSFMGFQWIFYLVGSIGLVRLLGHFGLSLLRKVYACYNIPDDFN